MVLIHTSFAVQTYCNFASVDSCVVLLQQNTFRKFTSAFDKRAILFPRIKHVLKQGMEIVTSRPVGNGIGWLLIDSPS